MHFGLIGIRSICYNNAIKYTSVFNCCLAFSSCGKGSWESKDKDGIPEELGKESSGMKDCLKGSGFLDFLGFLAAGLSPAGLDGESPTGLGHFGGFFLESAPATSDWGVTIGDNICIHSTVKLFYYFWFAVLVLGSQFWFSVLNFGS